MVTVGLYVPLEAKPGKEADVEAFLETGRELVEDEPGTTAWFAIRSGPSSYAIFDAFEDEAGRQAHLNGKVAEALMANADELLASPPQIHQLDILGAKLPAGT
jgi:quinol monooxygenase YgiN